LRAELAAKNLPATDEIAVLYAMFPRETEALLRPPAAKPAPAPAIAATPLAAPAQTPVTGGSHSRSSGAGPKHFFLSIGTNRHEISIEEVTTTS
jgi:pyruvate carboxylase subunit B